MIASGDLSCVLDYRIKVGSKKRNNKLAFDQTDENPVARADGAVPLCRCATFPPHCGGIFLSAAARKKLHHVARRIAPSDVLD